MKKISNPVVSVLSVSAIYDLSVFSKVAVSCNCCD